MKRYIRSSRSASRADVITIASYDEFWEASSQHRTSDHKYYLNITDAGYKDIANKLSIPDENARSMDKYAYGATSRVETFLYYARLFASNFREIKKRLGEVFPVYVNRLNPDLKSEALAAFAAMNISVAELGLRGVSTVIQTDWITVRVNHVSDYRSKVDAVVDALDSTGLVYNMTVNDNQDYTAIKATWNKENP